MTTYDLCLKLIRKNAGQKEAAPEAWAAFSADMLGKLDVFLLAGRLDEAQYSGLAAMLGA